MSGIIKSHLQLGDSATAANNFMVTAQAADGTMKIARGNNGATTQDVITVAADGNVQLKKTASQSMVRVDTANGFGSVNTAIRRYLNTRTNQGSDIIYADSASLGSSFTINTDGVYAISVSEQSNSTSTWIGITLNGTQNTLSVFSINPADVLSIATNQAGNGYPAFCSWTGYLPAGSVIRPHTYGSPVGNILSGNTFTIARVG
jgi:hypothetical protein